MNIFRTTGFALKNFIRFMLKRQTITNLLMFCFILLSAVGAGLIFLPAGLIVAGVTCGIFGFLLGLE